MSDILYFHSERALLDRNNNVLQLDSANLIDFFIEVSGSLHDSTYVLPESRFPINEGIKFNLSPTSNVICVRYPDTRQNVFSKFLYLFHYLFDLFSSQMREKLSSSHYCVSTGMSFFGMMAGISRVYLANKPHTFIIRGNRINTVRSSSRKWINKNIALMRLYIYQRILVSMIKRKKVDLWFQGEYLCNEYKNKLDSKYHSRLHVLNAVLRSLPEKNNSVDKKYDLIYTGRLTIEKGLLDLLDAIGLMNQSNKNVNLLLVGKGPDEGKLRGRAKNLGLDNQITFHGYESDISKLTHLLLSSRFFVLPSYTEGLPRSMVEAMRAKVPVIVTCVGGIKYIIEDGVNGFVIPVKNPSQLAVILNNLLFDAESDLIDKVVYNAYSTAEKFLFANRIKPFIDNSICS